MKSHDRLENQLLDFFVFEIYSFFSVFGIFTPLYNSNWTQDCLHLSKNAYKNNSVIGIRSRRVVVTNKRKYVHEVLVNCLFKLAQEKVWLSELTLLP